MSVLKIIEFFFATSMMFQDHCANGFVIRFGEDVDLDIPSCSAILDDEQHPGVGGDDLLVGGGDGMVPGPVLLVGVCLLELIKS